MLEDVKKFEVTISENREIKIHRESEERLKAEQKYYITLCAIWGSVICIVFLAFFRFTGS